MTEPTGIACTIDLRAASLPHRGAAVLERETGTVSAAAHTLKGTSDRGRRRTTPAFETHDLHAAAQSDIAEMRRAAAHLIGRCTAADPAADARLVALLGALAADAQPAEVRAEALMAKLLRGDTDRAPLAALAKDSLEAAGFLAQTGDATGWATVQRKAASDFAPDRVDAYAAAVDFTPLIGHGKGAPDVHALLAQSTKDSKVTVRQNAPRWLIAAGHPQARALIKTLAESDEANGVRVMAQHALRQLDR